VVGISTGVPRLLSTAMLAVLRHLPRVIYLSDIRYFCLKYRSLVYMLFYIRCYSFELPARSIVYCSGYQISVILWGERAVSFDVEDVLRTAPDKTIKKALLQDPFNCQESFWTAPDSTVKKALLQDPFLG
jgi:hypothetical protein